jgi:hypothetical protein
VTLSPEDFRVKYVHSGAPLRLVSSDGAVLKELMSLEQAVEALERSRLRLDAKVLVTNGPADVGLAR